MDVRIFADARDLAHAAAAEFALRAGEAIRERGTFAVALAGGSTPRALYETLASDFGAGSRGIPWDRVHVFWGDERCVPPDHPESNYRMAYGALLSKVPLPPEQIHRIRGELPDPARAAGEYEGVLREFLEPRTGDPPRLDLVLLGMGTDGHTASLFPGSPALAPDAPLVAAPWVGTLGVQRVTLTLSVLNRAACLLFLVAGPEKAEMLRLVLEGEERAERYPAQLIQPVAGRIVWMVDAQAARLLERRGGLR